MNIARIAPKELVFYDTRRKNNFEIENTTTRQIEYTITTTAGWTADTETIVLFPTQQDEVGQYITDENGEVIEENG